MILISVPLMLIAAKRGQWHVVVITYWATIFVVAQLLLMARLGVLPW